METKTLVISMELKPVTVNIEVAKNATNQEIIAAAEKAFAEKASTEKLAISKFTLVSQGENVENALTFDNAFVGQAVKTTKEGKYGVVTKINSKTINVTLAGANGYSQMVNGHPAAFCKVDKDVNLHEVLPKRNDAYKDMGIWNEGTVGYFADTKNKQVQFITVNKVTSAGNHQLSLVNENTNRIWKLTKDQMEQLVFDTLEEAEAALKK